jgi:hypothetical protein
MSKLSDPIFTFARRVNQLVADLELLHFFTTDTSASEKQNQHLFYNFVQTLCLERSHKIQYTTEKTNLQLQSCNV